MNRLKFIPGAVLLVGLFAAGLASAQTPQNVIAWNGNGQLICPVCFPSSAAQQFSDMTVLVTDANNNPVPNATVFWTVTIQGGSIGTLAQSQTTTDQNGFSSNRFNSIYFSGGALSTFVQTTISATSGNGAATFTLTQALANAQQGFAQPVQVLDASQITGTGQPLFIGVSLSGQAGSTSSTPIQVAVRDVVGIAVAGVAVNLYNLQPATSGPTVQCGNDPTGGGNNAVNGTVLTNANGIATCYPTFGGTPGTGNFNVLVGAPLSTAGDPNSRPSGLGFGGATGFGLTVTPSTPSSFSVVSGNTQSAQAGQSLSAPLVVQVVGSGGGPITGQTVTWSVSPAGAATLGSTSSVTDASGRASTTVKFAATASGSVTVTARLSGSNLSPVSFTVTAVPNITVTGLTIVSGNNQAAIVGTAFTVPLAVQVAASSGTPSGITVNFSVSPSGSATLSSSTATTGANGQAQVTVTAGNTAGPVTVTATAAGQTATFNLTISPPGPSLTAGAFVNGADLQRAAIAPCGLGSIYAPGVAPNLQNTLFGSSNIGPLPTTLSGEAVSFNGVAAPIVSVGTSNGQQQITFQVPCETTPASSVAVVLNVGAGSGSINVPVQAAAPGVFTTVLSDNSTHAVLVRPDGSFATIQNPARKGEIVTAFVTGLGPSSPAVPTGALPPPGITAIPQYQLVVGMSGGGVPLISAQLSPDRVGVWMLNFQIPAGVSSNNGLATFSVSVIPTGSSTAISSGTTTIPVQ